MQFFRLVRCFASDFELIDCPPNNSMIQPYGYGHPQEDATTPSRHQVLHWLADVISRYLAENQAETRPVKEYLTSEELRQRFDVTLGEQGEAMEGIFQAIQEYLQYSVRTGHPQFFNHLWAGFNLPAFLGDVIAALANTSMATYEVAPVATLMELELMRKMSRLAGFEDGEGIFTTGGTNSNTVALMVARNRAQGDPAANGLTATPAPLTLFVSERAHYSFQTAANMTGVGMQNVIKVAADELGRMRPDALEEAIVASKARGEQPLFVSGTACTTVMGAFDPLPAINRIARAHGLWFHVDASWGGGILLSPRYRYLLAGCELADSIAWNPHKLMSVSLPCSALLMREKGILQSNCEMPQASYLFHEYEDQDLDTGRRSLQCGRRVDALKLWLSWRYYGDAGYARRIERLFELAAYAARRVENEPALELQAPLQSLNVCFRYNPRQDHQHDLDQLNYQIRQQLLRSGNSMLNFAHLPSGALTMRLVFANPDIEEADLDQLFDHYLAAARELQPEASSNHV
jgi:glutamate/tyrosine decarboxylase-like PLP-dependent enzyme